MKRALGGLVVIGTLALASAPAGASPWGPPKQLHAQLTSDTIPSLTGRTDMTRVSRHSWTITTTIENAPSNDYTVGVTTAKGKQVFFNTVCDFEGEGTIGCTATVNLDEYLHHGKPVNVAVMASDPASGGFSTVAFGDLTR